MLVWLPSVKDFQRNDKLDGLEMAGSTVNVYKLIAVVTLMEIIKDKIIKWDQKTY